MSTDTKGNHLFAVNFIKCMKADIGAEAGRSNELCSVETTLHPKPTEAIKDCKDVELITPNITLGLKRFISLRKAK